MTRRSISGAAPPRRRSKGERAGGSVSGGAAAARSTSGGREWQSIELLRELLATAPTNHARMRPLLGIGDDAAGLAASQGPTLVWTIDGSVEGVHFRRDWLSLEDVGWRATHAAVSDVAAMGAVPVAALCHLVLPSTLTAAELRQLGRGQASAARELACPVIGGNVSSGPRLELATTVLGEVPPRRAALTRGGARPGDELWLLGDVGLAAAGQRALEAGLSLRALGACVAAWRRPRARVTEGLALQGRATACIDVSDGLVGDAAHLAGASGVALVLEEQRLSPVLAALERAGRRLGTTALELALWGGEDYALLATGPASRRPEGAHTIGQVEVGAGVWLDVRGERRPVEGGFEHLT